MSRLAAVIPAAGLSSRMGAFKPLLPLGQGTVLSECISLFQKNDIKQIIVVTGNRAGEVGAVTLQAGIQAVHNPFFRMGMFSSVLTGVRMLDPDISGFFMLPVDIPLVRKQTVEQLIDEFLKYPAPVLYPRFLRERGHPTLISSKLIPEILRHDGEGGLRTVLERYESHSRCLDVADYGTVHDLDHPGDYGLARTLVGREYPTEDECLQIWDIYSVPEAVRQHCQVVADVAEALCNRLNTTCTRGTCLDLELTVGAALTHDIGKGLRHHDRVGADRLRLHGFDDAAAIVENHTDRCPSPDETLCEADVVYMADKLVHGTSYTPLDQRYLEKLAKYGHIPDARNNILIKQQRAHKIMEMFERRIGRSVEKLACGVIK